MTILTFTLKIYLDGHRHFHQKHFGIGGSGNGYVIGLGYTNCISAAQ
jgi:hypothetical protein